MSLKEKLLDLFFPPRCAFCRRTGVHGVCADCERTLPYAKVQLCEGAGFGRCASPLLYEDAVRESLLRFKFHGAQSAAEGYGELLARCAAEELGGQFDTVTWVPVSKKREHERGYDQAYLLAKETARHWGIEPVRLLRKTRNNAAQSGLYLRRRAAGQCAGRVRGGKHGQDPRRENSAHRRYSHDRRNARRVRACTQGGRRGGCGVRDARPRRDGKGKGRRKARDTGVIWHTPCGA